jgi:hypothetical protein
MVRGKVLVGLLLATSLGCAAEDSDTEPALRASCALAQPTVEPATPAGGEAVVVSSSGFECDYRLPSDLDAELELALYQRGQGDGAIPLTSTSVDRDGSFEARFTVPDGAISGPASIYFDGPLALFPPCARPPGDESGCPLLAQVDFRISGDRVP